MAGRKQAARKPKPRWERLLRAYGARGWKELTPEERTAAYRRGLRHWQNSQGTLPEN